MDDEHPLLGLPLLCASDPVLIKFLLTFRYRDELKRGIPAFHALLMDERLALVDDIVSKFTDCAQGSKRYDFQEDIWKKDKNGAYPLHLVFNATKSRELIGKLVDCFPQALRKQDNRGLLPLHHALKCDAPIAIIDLLVDKYPGSVSVETKQGTTALHVAAGHTNSTALMAWVSALFPEAKEKQDHRGWLPMHHAIRHTATVEVIKWFVEMYPDGSETRDIHGSSLIHLACKHRSTVDVIKYLVGELGSEELSALDNNGCIPMHIACRHGSSKDVLTYLIKMNESGMIMPDNRGELPIHKACRGGHIELLETLMDTNPSLVSTCNALNELPILILSKKSGKSEDVLESIEYTEAIWKLLLAHPETVSV